MSLFWLAVTPHARAAFSDLVPLAYSGNIYYTFGYQSTDASESESTSYSANISASGYVWRPWFVTTSAALGFSSSKTKSQASSGSGVATTGSLALQLFPHSRFPSSVSYSRSDSATESFNNNAAQASGQLRMLITRLTFRQVYSARNGWRSNMWYITSDMKGANSNSNRTSYGITSKYRRAKQYITISATQSESRVGGVAGKVQATTLGLSHSYTPTAEFGVISLLTAVRSLSTNNSSDSTNKDATSSFSWRPEHRQLTVSGAVRLSKNVSKNENSSSETKGLATQLGLGYRVTRYVYLSAGTTLNSQDNGAVQILSSTQRIALRYQPVQLSFWGFSYGWQTGAGASNSSSRTSSSGVDSSANVSGSTDSSASSRTPGNTQSYSLSLGHSMSRALVMGKRDSGSFLVSQSGSMSESSESVEPSYALSQSVGFSWSHRGRVGSLYAGASYSDSRNYARNDSVFQSFAANLSSGLTINRQSSLQMEARYQNSNGEAEADDGSIITTVNQSVSSSAAYKHSRPFGLYNTAFSAYLSGSRRIGSSVPSATYTFGANFSYSLGLLALSLTYSATESAGGTTRQSMFFRATRSF